MLVSSPWCNTPAAEGARSGSCWIGQVLRLGCQESEEPGTLRSARCSSEKLGDEMVRLEKYGQADFPWPFVVLE